MKVLMTADAVGGVWTYSVELCAALSQLDVEVVLAVLGQQPSASQRDQAQALSNVRLQTADYKLEWMHEPWDDVARAGEWLLQLAEREKVQLVHLNGFVHAALPWQTPVLVVAHSCVYSWWRAVHGSAPPNSWQTYQHFVQAGISHADVVVSPSKSFLSALRDEYAIGVSTRVIPNAIRAEHLRNNNGQRKEPVIFASGRLWDEAKNIGVLDIAATGLPWQICVAGETTSPEGKQRLLNNVRCIGVQTSAEIVGHLQRASIFVHPALYEPFGLSVLEAAHAGCALVLSNIPTLRELWEEAAVFVDATNPNSIREALRPLIEDERRRERLGRLAFERAARFSTERMALAYREIYLSLTDRKSVERSVA
jgi:glycogen(starch) synthase